LGLLTLLFFFECKLHRQGKKGGLELADYLYELTHEQLGVEQEKYTAIADMIIDTFRDAMGRRHTEEFYNWETGTIDSFQFSILKTDTFDQEQNRQYFTLDEEGLELVFATKEYFSEFRISISQLLIRKQLEKGEFTSALHEIHEMRIAVQSLRDHIKRLGLEVTRNIISSDTYEKYEKTINHTHERLQREDEEFRELYTFIRDTKAKMQVESYQDVDEEARVKIAQVANELSDVHQLHHSLLYDVISLKNKALEAACQALFSVGIQGFNFDNEIVSRIVSSPLPVQAVGALMHPFTKLHQHKGWSPLALFFPQRLQRNGKEVDNSEAYPEYDELGVSEDSLVQEQNFYKIMEHVLLAMGKKQSIELKEVVEKIPEELLGQRSFYDFWLLLHQRSPLTKGKGDARHVLDKALALLGNASIEVIEGNGILRISEQYNIQNMHFIKRSL